MSATTSAAQRLCYPISRAEIERRWAAVREIMREAQCEALLIQAANNFTGTAGHFRWLTGVSVASSYPQTAIFPREGLITIVMHGGFGEQDDVDGSDPAAPGVGRKLFAPSFPAVNYCGSYDAELIAGELKKSSYRRIGLLSPNTWYAGMAVGLQRLLDGVEYVDLTSQIDLLKAVKSEEELALIRQTAAMQDTVLEKVREHIRPGKKEFEIMAYGQYLGQLLGSEGGYFLGSSAPPGEPTLVRRRVEQGRELRDGDVFYFQCENSGPGGMFTHVGRYFVLGKAPQQLQDMFGAAVDAQNFTISLLEPGARCSEIFAEYNGYMHARGYKHERRVHCHGQGYDVVEPPLIRQDETMTLGSNTNIGFHPGITRGKLMVTCCDNLFIGPNGKIEMLHKTPREIIELS
jgi:Xaa-Pro aminopeptidase